MQITGEKKLYPDFRFIFFIKNTFRNFREKYLLNFIYFMEF